MRATFGGRCATISTTKWPYARPCTARTGHAWPFTVIHINAGACAAIRTAMHSTNRPCVAIYSHPHQRGRMHGHTHSREQRGTDFAAELALVTAELKDGVLCTYCWPRQFCPPPFPFLPLLHPRSSKPPLTFPPPRLHLPAFSQRVILLPSRSSLPTSVLSSPRIHRRAASPPARRCLCVSVDSDGDGDGRGGDRQWQRRLGRCGGAGPGAAQRGGLPATPR
eukprot:353509-Chlamydomonas_euryale.AAC.5